MSANELNIAWICMVPSYSRIILFLKAKWKFFHWSIVRRIEKAGNGTHDKFKESKLGNCCTMSATVCQFQIRVPVRFKEARLQYGFRYPAALTFAPATLISIKSSRWLQQWKWSHLMTSDEAETQMNASRVYIEWGATSFAYLSFFMIFSAPTNSNIEAFM